jgi:hypothetical protein
MPASLEDWRNAATVASATIALIALFRPELQKLVARFVGSLHIYPVGERVEIGFSIAGATTGLEVILRARSRDFFIRDAKVEVVRLKDGARHTLSWGALRSPAMIFGNQQPTEIPAGFLLEPKAPRRLNIAFQDRELRDEIVDILSALREKWWEALREAGLFPPPDATSENADYRAAINDFYDEFSKEAGFVASWESLQRLCYWQPGDYHAVVKFNSTEPEQTFNFSCRFSLSKAESDRLHANAIPMLRQNVGFTDASLFFAYSKFQALPSTAQNS